MQYYIEVRESGKCGLKIGTSLAPFTIPNNKTKQCTQIPVGVWIDEANQPRGGCLLYLKWSAVRISAAQCIADKTDLLEESSTRE